MKIYLAGIAVGTEGTKDVPIMTNVPVNRCRLFSYWHIIPTNNHFDTTDVVFEEIKRRNNKPKRKRVKK